MTKDVNMSSETVVPPPAVWAQKGGKIFLTLNIECSEPVYKFTEDSMSFSGVGMPEGKKYELNVEFYNKINPEKVATKNIKRCIEFVIDKADEHDRHWPRLLKDTSKPHWLKVDFNRWEDDGSNDEDNDGGMDMMEMLQANQNSNKLSLNDLSDDADDDDYPDDDVPYLM